MEEEKAFLGGFPIEDFGNDGGGSFLNGSTRGLNNRKGNPICIFPSLFWGEPRYILSLSGGRGLG